MSLVTARVECDIPRGFRVDQVIGMFDLAQEKRVGETFEVEMPLKEDDWSIGAIVGPSGSGKSTIAREAFGEAFIDGFEWPRDLAVVDCFGEASIREITQTLTAVGLSSPPSWIKPYRVLSTGERFRCDLARAMLLDSPVVAFDEFTSVVDRNVARFGSMAVGRAIRRGSFGKKLVVVSCHYDILEWLEPDWVVDMATQSFKKVRLRRPDIQLEIVRCRRSAWQLFSRHHYLSGSISTGSTCYAALWQGQPVAFCAMIAMYGHRGFRRIHRLVVLPDFQGVGIGRILGDTVADIYTEAGYRVRITSSHPAMIAANRRSHKWRMTNVSRAHQGQVQRAAGKIVRTSFGRNVVSFEYIGSDRDKAESQ